MDVGGKAQRILFDVTASLPPPGDRRGDDTIGNKAVDAPIEEILQVPGIVASSPMLEFHDNVSIGGGVTKQTTLLGVGRTTLYQWKAGKVVALDRHVLERLSYLFGIYAALQILVPVKERADGWVREPNTAPLFGGRSALDRMMGGQVADLYVVRHYLDAQRGGKA